MYNVKINSYVPEKIKYCLITYLLKYCVSYLLAGHLALQNTVNLKAVVVPLTLSNPKFQPVTDQVKIPKRLFCATTIVMISLIKLFNSLSSNHKTELLVVSSLSYTLPSSHLGPTKCLFYYFPLFMSLSINNSLFLFCHPRSILEQV